MHYNALSRIPKTRVKELKYTKHSHEKKNPYSLPDNFTKIVIQKRKYKILYHLSHSKRNYAHIM